MEEAFDNGGSVVVGGRQLPSIRVLVDVGFATAAHHKGGHYLVTLTEAGAVEEQARRACA